MLAFKGAEKELEEKIKMGFHAKKLISLGFEEDVKYCCMIDVFEISPKLKMDGRIPRIIVEA